MKRRIFTTLDNLAKRDIFDAKYAQLEKRRENLDKQIRREEREAKIVLAKENVVEFTAKAKKYAKKQAKKSGIRRKVSLRCRRPCKKRVFGLAHDIQFSSFAQGENDQIRQIRR